MAARVQHHLPDRRHPTRPGPCDSSRAMHMLTLSRVRTPAPPQPAYALTERVLAESPSGATGRGPFSITNVAPVSLDTLKKS